jgi:hypothetical protein
MPNITENQGEATDIVKQPTGIEKTNTVTQQPEKKEHTDNEQTSIADNNSNVQATTTSFGPVDFS